jgi:hypothetical protein
VPLAQAPFSNGLIWRLEARIGLGSGKICAVLALDAQHPQLLGAASALEHGHCIGGSVGESWTGAAIAAVLDRLIAPMGRPAASRKDGGSDRHKAADVLEARGLGRPCIDDSAHAAAGLLQPSYQHHPAFERFVSACGRVSGTLQHTILACLAPPTVRPQARVMHGHRLCTWAERRLQLSPPGGAKTGSLLARLRSCMDELPACQDLIKRCGAAAHGGRACQQMVKPKGRCHDPLAHCQPLLSERPAAPWRLELAASLAYQLATATT